MGIIAPSLLNANAYRQAVLAAGVDDVVRKAELTTGLPSATQPVMQADRSQ